MLICRQVCIIPVLFPPDAAHSSGTASDFARRRRKIARKNCLHPRNQQRQQRLRLRDAGADEVVVGCCTHVAAEQAQEVAAAHVRLTQQVIQCQRLIVLFADGLRRLLDHLLIALRLLLIQQPLRAQRQQLMQRQRHLQHTVHRAALQLGENRLELFFHFLVS